jgi:hypothetical protein
MGFNTACHVEILHFDNSAMLHVYIDIGTLCGQPDHLSLIIFLMAW